MATLPRVLFLCTGNSCRSQMAEGWARALLAGHLEAHSAGTDPHGLDPRAVRAMAEAGVDIAGRTSKRPGDIGVPFDVVVTVCDSAHESCPTMPGAHVVHVPFDDPPRLAAHAATEEEAMAHYRRVRDEIRAFVERLPKALAVRAGYARIAAVGSWTARESPASTALPVSNACCTPAGGCCGPATFTPAQLAQAIGYTRTELDVAPEASNMGLSCGNPTALASLQRGETVLDLGAGGGFDCFIAGAKVGPDGKVIGVDMTSDMVSLARRNAASYESQTGFRNVEFRLGEIERLPVADATVDVVISNCVLNLSPDKPRVWREIARVLKPGGRVAVSDLVLLKPLPDAVRHDLEALVGCIAGAALADDLRQQASDAGLRSVSMQAKPEYVDALTRWEDPLYRRIMAALPQGAAPGDYVVSMDICAIK